MMMISLDITVIYIQDLSVRIWKYSNNYFFMILVLNSKLPKLFLVNFGAYIINFFLINIYNRIYLPFKKRGERSFLYAVFDFIYDLNWKNVIKSSQNKSRNFML